MVQESEVMKIGDKYYLATDVQKVLANRIQAVAEEDIIFEQEQ